MAAAGKGGDYPEDCPMCLTCFDDLVQRPRTLPCGHTVCTLCIDKLKEQGHVTCPECRISHAVPEGGQFPVSYTIEALIKRVRDFKVAAAAVSLPPSARKRKRPEETTSRKVAAGLSKKFCSFLQEQEATVVAAITACQEVQSQLDQYQATLIDWGKCQQQLEDRLQGLMEQSRSAKELVHQETSHVVTKKEKVKKKEKELQAVQETMRTPATEQEVFKVVGEVLHCTDEVEQVLEECQRCFPDTGTLTTAKKVREACTAVLDAVQVVQAASETVTSEEADPKDSSSQSDAEELSSQSDSDLTIMEKVNFIFEPNLKAKDLRSLTHLTRSLLQAGWVFAVHQVEGQLQHARISLDAGRLFLHALREQCPPRGASMLQVSEVVPPCPPCTAFLDLSWPGRAPRRVHIRLSPDTPRGRQFMLLCTGQRGPSYRNTTLFKIGNKGMQGEYVLGGDYERNDGEGKCVLLPNIGKAEYQKSDRAGTVFGMWNTTGHFSICTRGRAVGDRWSYVFGEVVEGLDVVAEAAQHSIIKEVTVVDCGLVL